MEVNEITTSAELEALSGDWSELWERCPEATPFQAPEWLLPWWLHRGRGRLWTLAVRDCGRLVGLAPLFRTDYYGLPVRRMCLLGTGNSDYLDFLIDRDCADDVAGALGGHLRSAPDFCDLHQAAPGAAVWRLEAFPNEARATILGAPTGFRPKGRAWTALPQETCPFLALPEGVEAWSEGLPGKLRANLRYYRRRLEREGAVIEAATDGTVDELLTALFRLHAARWRRRRLPGVFANGRVQAFHREAAAGFLRRGWLRLYGLRVRGKVRAVLYCSAARGRTFYYAGGFDPELAPLSPGTVLTGHAIEQAVHEGCAEFDFLRGNEAYKYAWGARDRVNSRLVRSASAAPLCLVRAEQRLEVWGKGMIRRFTRG